MKKHIGDMLMAKSPASFEIANRIEKLLKKNIKESVKSKIILNCIHHIKSNKDGFMAGVKYLQEVERQLDRSTVPQDLIK